jgi:hypothetical protein
MLRMNSSSPTTKVAAGAIAGAVTTIIIWLLKSYAHTEIPGDVGAAMAAILTFVVSYAVPPSSSERDQVVTQSLPVVRL